MKEILKYNLSEIDEAEGWLRALKITPLLAWRKNKFDIFWRQDDDNEKHYMTMDTKYMYPPKTGTTCIHFGLTGSDEIHVCIKKENNTINIYIK
jgi:hypothetical protein